MKQPVRSAPDLMAHLSDSRRRGAGAIAPNLALGLLTLGYVVNFADRTLIGVAQEAIRLELGLSDLQLGLLNGISFALFYSFMGIPVARLAERFNRPRIIAAALAGWSLMTMLCGTVTSFAQFFMCRMGVGIGEAGATPPAHAYIADIFAPERRTRAISIYCVGLPLGMVAGSLLGGMCVERYGWRVAFVMFGLAGLPIALLILRYCPEYGSTRPGAKSPPIAWLATLRHLARIRQLHHVAAGLALASIAGYALAAFSAAYFMRTFAVGAADAGLIVGLAGAASSGVGTYLGGWLVDRGKRRDARWQYWVPMIGLTCAAPLFVLAYSQTQLAAAVALLVLPSILQFFYLGPVYAVGQSLVPAGIRATTSAMLLLAANLFGLGLGPGLLGLASDAFAAAHFGAGYAVTCEAQAMNALFASAACSEASILGLRWAIMAMTVFFIWGAFHFWAASRCASAGPADHG